jgi:2-methylisocitrate lyase-like PEP mutase family enzyme
MISSLKQRLARRDAMLMPGAASALTARIIEDLGFEAVYITGAGVTNTFLGQPDLGLLSLTELADHVAAMRDAVELPLVVDADTGFGNAINVGRTVRVLERSGANAIQIEDQEMPKRCGHFSGKRVIDTWEMVQKVRAAVDARHSSECLIVARTDALAANGFEDAMERASRFIEAGADVTFVEAPRTPEQVRAIPARLAVPQLSNMVPGGLTPVFDVGELRAMGYAIVLYANAALQAGIVAMQRVLRHLNEHGSLKGAEDMFADFSERQRVVGKHLYDMLEAKYGASESDAKASARERSAPA